MAARWPDAPPAPADTPAATATPVAAGCTDAFLADLGPLPPFPVDPGEPFAVFAAIPGASGIPRTDPETRGEQLRDDPVDDWLLDRWQDRHERAIYGEQR